MDSGKQNLKGSPSRDAFKHWHKQPPMPDSYYATDLDFLLVTKKDGSGIVAVLDYKQPGDKTTFAEVIAYNDLLNLGIPIYIIRAKWLRNNPSQPFNSFTIDKYLGGNSKPEPPEVQLQRILENGSIMEYIEWERQLRINWRKNERR